MLVAFHNKQSVKDKYLKRVQKHYELDEIIQGVYWEKGKGCAVGCTIQSSKNPHEMMEKELGVPRQLSYLEDVIFEELSNGKAKEFPLRFLKAINPGADLSKIVGQIVVWQWENKKFGLKSIKEIKDDKETMYICEKVVNAYKKELAGTKVSQQEWEDLYQEADKLYWAWAGARVGVGARARVGAWAWVGAEYDQTYEESIEALADKLISLLEETK